MKSWLRHRESIGVFVFRYCAALAIVGIGLAIRYWTFSAMEKSGFAVTLIAMLMAAWIGGVGPCLVAQTVLLFAEALWFKESHEVHSPGSLRGAVSLLAYYGVGCSVAALSEAWRAARSRAVAERLKAVSQREQLRATIACVADGVIATDSSGRVTLMNPAAERLTGWRFDESRGTPIHDIFLILDEHTQEPVENPIDRVLGEERELHGNVHLILTTRQPTGQPVSYSVSPVLDEAGRTTGAVLILRDESERRRTEQALREADRRKDEFLATLAHELRNPLAPICMGFELLKFSSGDDRQKVQEIHEMMHRQTKHMVRLIDDLLDVSRISRGTLALRREQVRLAEVLEHAIEAAQPALEAAGQQISVKATATPIVVDADPNRLMQVFANLLNNASKYTPAGGKISLDTSLASGKAAVTVTDTGCGIPPEKLEAIFEMFTQLPNDMEHSQRGLGIGLTLVKRLVELHGGNVSAVSAGPGRGSTFRVELPTLQLSALAAPDANAPAMTRGTAGRRILVVDDHPDILSSTSKLLRCLGHEVYLAACGAEAIELAELHQPDVVLLDIGMPGMSGYEAAARIRQYDWGRSLMLIAATGWGQDEDRRKTREAGFDHHLVKPISFPELQQLILSRPGSKAGAKSSEATSNGLASTTISGRIGELVD